MLPTLSPRTILTLNHIINKSPIISNTLIRTIRIRTNSSTTNHTKSKITTNTNSSKISIKAVMDSLSPTYLNKRIRIKETPFTTIKVETSEETTEVMIVVVLTIEVVALIVVEEDNNIWIKEVSKDSSTNKTNKTNTFNRIILKARSIKITLRRSQESTLIKHKNPCHLYLMRFQLSKTLNLNNKWIHLPKISNFSSKYLKLMFNRFYQLLILSNVGLRLETKFIL